MPAWLIILFHSLGRKSAAKRTGIAKIPTTISAEGHGAGLYTQLREAGFTDEALTKLIKSEKDIIRLVNKVESMQKQQTSKVISQGDSEFQGITDKLLGKKTKVHPFTGFTPRVQQDVDSIIKNLKSMEPMDAMKEANLVIGRKGNYKHLSNDEAQRILKDTDDHIFQRDIKPDPEDMASGGIAGQLHLNEGGRARFANGLSAYQEGMQLMGPSNLKNYPGGDREEVWDPYSSSWTSYGYDTEGAAAARSRIAGKLGAKGQDYLSQYDPASTISSQDQDLLKYTGSGL